MKIIELEHGTHFEFECDLIINDNLQAEFDNSRVQQVTDLCKLHNIPFVIRVGDSTGDGYNATRLVTVQTLGITSELFHYDLTTLMLH